MDQFIVNGYFIKAVYGLRAETSNFRIFSPAFLFENDDTYGGQKLFRTWNGMKYQGGYSDHLPVILDLQ